MSRVAFAQRYSLAGTILTEPWAPTGAETYYARRREWFTYCRLCGCVTAHPDGWAAQRAATRTCPESDCPPPPPAALCAHCGLRKRQPRAYRGALCDRCQRDPKVTAKYRTNRKATAS